MDSLSKLAFTFFLSILLAFNAVATDYFVDASKPAANDAAAGGLTWETAFKTVPFALSVADGTGVNNRIFVKQGTYTMTATAYTFINSSITLHGGFPTAAAGTDISGYSQANITNLDYNFASTTSSSGTVVVQNTVAGLYIVTIKGFTVTDMGGSGSAYSDFFIADAVGTVNTTFSFTDMTHTLTPPIAINANDGVNSIYDLENISASNVITFTNCNFVYIRAVGSNFGAITIRNSAVAATLTTCTFDKTSNVGLSSMIFLENVSASPKILNVAADNKFINAVDAITTRYVNFFTLYKNTGDFVIDELTNPVDNNQAGATLPGTFLRAWGSTNGATTSPVAQANPGKITIKNVTFTNTDEGGVIAIYSYGGRGDVDISNNTFTNNVNTNGVGGGAILVMGVLPAVTTGLPNVTISGNTFTGNGSNLVRGGAIGILGNGQMLKYNNIDLKNNTFTNNTSEFGGAISIFQAVAASVKITNSSFTGNTSEAATGSGGAIELRSLDAPKDLLGNTYCGNKVVNGGEGGAIYHVSSTSTADFPLNVHNSVFNANEAPFGSGIFIETAPSFHLNTSTFSENAASNSSTVFVNTLLFQSDIDSCVFVRNTSLTGTPGVYISATTKIFYITKTNFTANFTSSGTAGAIIFNETTALASKIEDCLFDGNASADGPVGAIAASNSTIATSLLVNRCVFKNNYSGFNPLNNTKIDSDVRHLVATTIVQPNITNSYLQSPLIAANYKAANIAPAANNVVISASNTFIKTGTNGCAAVPLVYQLGAAPTSAGTTDCAKTQISPAPVAGTASQTDLIVTINVTTAGEFTPITLSGSGMTLANGVTSITATTTGVQQFHIPIKYDGTALGTLNFQIGTLTACTADLTLAPKSVVCPIWTLDNCSPVQVGPVLK